MRYLLVLLLVSCTSGATASAASCSQKTVLSVDTSLSLQAQLTTCSNAGFNCVIDDIISVEDTLYIWGDSCLTGSGELVFNIDNISDPYLLNVGISGKSGGSAANNQAENPFTGSIENLTFTINNQSAEQGRLIYYWRTKGSKLENNTFNLGTSRYSATTSGNHNGWLSGALNYIREDIEIRGNTITAQATNLGSEGIGLGLFNGAVIEHNVVIGVGDDPIGVHISENITISHNVLEAVDGRIYVSNSLNVEIAHNHVTRVASPQNGLFYKGIALVYSGWEHKNTNSLPAPENYYIHHNELYYNDGAIDGGAAINILGSRNMTIEHNYIENNSTGVTATAIHILPEPFKPGAIWTDPTGLDTGTARVYGTLLTRNVSTDQRMIMTGNCVDHAEPITVNRNIATNYQFYCDSIVTNNRSVY